MDTILFLAHVEPDGSLAKPALEALGAAQSLARALNDAPLTVGLIGENLTLAAHGIGGCGAARMIGVSGEDFTQARYSTDAAAAAAIGQAAQPAIIIVPGTSRWLRVLAGLAHRLQGRSDSHVTGISAVNGAPAITRWYYRQRMEAVQQRTHRPWVIALDPGCGEPWTGPASSATVEFLSVALNDSAKRTRILGLQSPPADAQTIRPDAKVLLVAGAGWTKKQADGKVHAEEAQKSILDFLNLAQGSLGGTKSLVDLSGEGQAVLPFMTHLNQVGQTGSTPRHPKGLATCCHGEEPHVVGWRFINERRAVNLDPNCGWARGKADILYVADAFAVMARVNALLAAL
jgi:electron transfer flavoprotein alpha subunit